MPINTNDTSLRDSFYQVPAKTLGEFNITHDKIYTQTLSDDNDQLFDMNFGKLASLSAVPPASTSDIGGIRLYSDTDDLGQQINQSNKLYPVQLTSINGKDSIAFVQVPWLNTTYVPDDDTPHGTNYLCIEWANLSDDLHGGQFKIGIKTIPVTLLSGIGDMVLSDDNLGDKNYGSFEKVKAAISNPLYEEIETAKTEAQKKLTTHEARNATDFAVRDANIEAISVNLRDNYYKKVETSSNTQLKTQFIGLSNDFVKYLNNSLFQGQHTNPSYLSTETSSATQIGTMFEQLSDAVENGYMYKYEAYLCSETSSKTELANKFNTKQDNLTINTNIEDGVRYGSKDIATVNAISSFVHSRLEEFDAVFHGYFDSLSEVYNDGTKYKHGVPNKNDYIFVNVTAKDVNAAGFDFYKHSSNPVGVWRMKISGREWQPSLNKSNWTPEYKITENAFTTDQVAALNSGINASLVHDIMSYAQLSAALVKQFPNMIAKLGALAALNQIEKNIVGTGKTDQLAIFTNVSSVTGLDFVPTKEKWIFELQDNNQRVARYVLTQPAPL